MRGYIGKRKGGKGESEMRGERKGEEKREREREKEKEREIEKRERERGGDHEIINYRFYPQQRGSPHQTHRPVLTSTLYMPTKHSFFTTILGFSKALNKGSSNIHTSNKNDPVP